MDDLALRRLLRTRRHFFQDCGVGLGKIALDVQIQDEIPEQQRTSAFARSETLLQLAWVLGGFIGIAMPLNPTIGLGVLAGLILVWTTYVVISRPSHAAG